MVRDRSNRTGAHQISLHRLHIGTKASSDSPFLTNRFWVAVGTRDHAFNDQIRRMILGLFKQIPNATEPEIISAEQEILVQELVKFFRQTEIIL